MRLGLAQAPVERLGLVTKHVAGLSGLVAFRLAHCNRKRIVCIIFRRGHRQTDDQRGLFIEDARREYQEGMDIAHLAPDLRVAVDPDDILPVRRPGFALECHLFAGCCFPDSYQRSAPSVCVVDICSPP